MTQATPDVFAEKFLKMQLYPKQRAVLQALAQRHSPVSFCSCNEGGKTKRIICAAILWHLMAYPRGHVITIESEMLVTSSTVINFPNPPTTSYATNMVTGNLTVSMSETGANLSFNTGPVALTWNGSAYSYSANTDPLSLPLGLSYSLVTGGETYTGSQNANLAFYLTLGAEINSSGYPTSITLDPDPSWNLSYDAPGFTTLANFTAANGLQTDIVAITATPEPSCWTILAFGSAIVWLFRCAKMSKTSV